MGWGEITQQSEIGNKKRRAKCRTLENRCQVSLKEEGGPSAVVWQSLMEMWSGNRYLSVGSDPLRGALTHGRAVPWSELQVHERKLEVTPDLPVPFTSSSSHLYSSPSSLCPSWLVPPSKVNLPAASPPLCLCPCLVHQTSVVFQHQPRAAGHFVKGSLHSAPSLKSRGLGPKWSGKTSGFES